MLLPSTVLDPRQERSARLLRKVERAAQQLIAARGYDAVGMADIAARAGVSTGVLYTRFASKEHLLVHLAREHVVTLVDAIQRAYAAAEGATIAALAEQYFALSAALYVKHRAIFRAVSLVARQTGHPELREIVAAFNEAIHARIREGLLLHRGAIAHRDAVRAIDFAIAAGSATVRELLLYTQDGSPSEADCRRVVAECARAFSAYLTCGHPPLSSPPTGRTRRRG